MNIDYKIERIQNGYIVTGNDSSKTKRYFKSLGDIIQSEIMEPLVDRNDQTIHSYREGDRWELKASFSRV